MIPGFITVKPNLESRLLASEDGSLEIPLTFGEEQAPTYRVRVKNIAGCVVYDDASGKDLFHRESPNNAHYRIWYVQLPAGTIQPQPCQLHVMVNGSERAYTAVTCSWKL